jgi:hypothetical protein
MTDACLTVVGSTDSSSPLDDSYAWILLEQCVHQGA